MIKLVTRGTSSTADAYLTPVLRQYIDGFFAGFDESLMKQETEPNGRRRTRVEFMRSDGGLTDVERFSGLHSILSGPAGGVVGYARTTFDPVNKIPLIGLDMGGTSTDVSRFDGRYETVFESTTAGVTIQSPQLDINTVAAGGGSRLFWRNGLFVTGPESAGASPGPACYRKGGPLAVTDANLLLGRLIPEYFPKIFGPNEDQELDVEASRSLFEELRNTINRDLKEELSLDQVAWGFIKIANETMCRPIRALTEARGYASSKHILSVFGGAGGQHACSLARTLGITRIVIHRHASILSAYGMALADRVVEAQLPSATVYHSTGQSRLGLEKSLDTLQEKVGLTLRNQGFEQSRIVVERYLNMRYDGTDTALMVLDQSTQPSSSPSSSSNHHKGSQKDVDEEAGKRYDYLDGFREAYLKEFGFLLDRSIPVICDDVRVRGIGKSTEEVGESVDCQLSRIDFKRFCQDSDSDQDTTPKRRFHSVFFEDLGRVETPIFDLEQFGVGDYVVGPAVLLDHTQTVIVDPHAQVRFLKDHLVIDF